MSDTNLVNNVKHNLNPNQLNRETDVIHLTLSGLHGGHYLDPSNSLLFGQTGMTVTYLEKPNTGGATYNPDPRVMPPVVRTVIVSETIKGVPLSDGTKAVEIIPATVRVPNQNGWTQIMNMGTLPSLTDASKLIYLKKGNNAAGLASIFPLLTSDETEELVAVAFANPAKVWTDKWASEVYFKNKYIKIEGYGVNGGSPLRDVLNTAWAQEIRD